MKIAIITNHSYMLYRFRKDLIQKLLEENEVVISTPCVGHEDDLRNLGCRVVDTRVDRRGINPMVDVQLVKRYLQFLRVESPDKVITYSIKPNIYAGMLCRYKKIPYYANVQGLGTAFQSPILASMVTVLYKHAFRKVKTVFFENKANAALFQKRRIIPKEKEKILNGAGINLNDYQYCAYPMNEEKIHFLYVGRIMKEKGVDELFEAFKQLRQKYQNIILDIVGFFEDEYRDVIDELVKDESIIFHGFQQDVIPYYQKAHCVVLPSYHEGMSNVLLEACAIGRPVITSNIPGCKEAVNNQVNGYLVHVKDSQDLYKKMKDFVDLNIYAKETMGKYARDKMKREFNKEMVVKQTYECIMNERE